MIPFAVLVDTIHDLLPGAQIDIDESLDLAAAALEEDDPVLEKSRLVSRGYIHGRHRRWVVAGPGDDATVISLTIHEFKSVQESQLSVADLRERLRAAAVTNLRSTSTSLEARYPADDGSHLSCISQLSGRFQVIVVARTPTSESFTAIAVALADRQSERLSQN